MGDTRRDLWEEDLFDLDRRFKQRLKRVVNSQAHVQHRPTRGTIGAADLIVLSISKPLNAFDKGKCVHTHVHTHTHTHTHTDAGHRARNLLNVYTYKLQIYLNTS